MPLGPDYDSFKLYVFVNIIDDSNGVTTFQIQSPIQVFPETKLLNSYIDEMISSTQSSSSLVTKLQQGSINFVSSLIISLSSSLNMITNQSSLSNNSSQENLSLNDKKATARSFLIDVVR